MNKYLVVAVKWNDGKGRATNYVAGEFPEYHLARLFRDAYNEEFKANAVIVDFDADLLQLKFE